jgi:ATP synthase protein I
METAAPASPLDAARLQGARAPAWDEDDAPVRRLSAGEAAKFRDQRRSPSPWRVVLMQAEAGVVFALIAGLLSGWAGAWSALYGAATAAVPGAILARAVSRTMDSRSPAAAAASMLGWESVKLVCTAAMLVAAHRILHPVVWLALLAALMGCLMVYWVALVRRPHSK